MSVSELQFSGQCRMGGCGYTGNNDAVANAFNSILSMEIQMMRTPVPQVGSLSNVKGAVPVQNIAGITDISTGITGR